MNKKFKQQIVNIVNKNYPTLNEIIDNYFNAIDRFSNSEKINKKEIQVNTVGLAVNIDKRKELFSSSCYICNKIENKNSKHFTSECPNFSSVQDKINQLKLLGYCIKCAGSKHKSRECNFEFKKLCFYCKDRICLFYV